MTLYLASTSLHKCAGRGRTVCIILLRSDSRELNRIAVIVVAIIYLIFPLRRNVLQMSSGLYDQGHVVWYLAIAQFVVVVFIFFAIIKGIKSAGKVGSSRFFSFGSRSPKNWKEPAKHTVSVVFDLCRAKKILSILPHWLFMTYAEAWWEHLLNKWLLVLLFILQMLRCRCFCFCFWFCFSFLW